jgi:HTH-type transcriptional regulator / antitoxin HigA
MELKVIKNDSQYHSMLQEAERLVSLDPERDTEDAERLELLSVLIEDFEKRNYFFDVPDPIDAIQFRMEEQGLRQVDLAPLLGGSRSRVSEILSRKRPLSVAMIRSISAGLGIPYQVLLSEQNTGSNSRKAMTTEEKEEWDKFPIKEMVRRGWINLDLTSKINSLAKETTENILKTFLTQIYENDVVPAHFRRTFRGNASTDEKSFYSTLAWSARVLQRAKQSLKVYKRFDPSELNGEFFVEIARLSRLVDGPRKVGDILAEKGIALVIEPKLPNTLLDGAAMLSKNGLPVIGMTLRYDRVDYFWFTLLHELAHIWKHIDSSDETFIDRVENTLQHSVIEKEADRIARDALIPRAVWKRSSAYLNPSPESIEKLAEQLSINPAIIVGRLQKDYENYSMFRDMLGQNSVQSLFPELSFT